MDDLRTLLELYRVNALARWIDLMEKRYVASGQAHFHLSGLGHGASSAICPFLLPEDWLFCHYRAKALMLARGASPRAFFDGFFAKEGSASGGRLLGVHFHDTHRRLFCIAGPVGNSALHAVGVASVVKDKPQRPIVVFGIGDGSTQQGEVLEAISEAVRSRLPVLFLVEDNGYAISTRTLGSTFFSLPAGDASQFLGIEIRRVDGRRIADCLTPFQEAVEEVRSRRGPAIVVLKTERMDSHSNADDQKLYRDSLELERLSREEDPFVLLEEELRRRGASEELLRGIQSEAELQVTQAAREAFVSSEPRPCRELWFPPFSQAEESSPAGESSLPLTMLEAIRLSLASRLQKDPRVMLYGQDIEDPKGDVFGVTRGLSTRFPSQVENAPLSESTILGVSIGRAMAGKRPVAMLQFADFLPLAFNQLSLELAPFLWRTKGEHAAPVIVMAPVGGYRAGLGPYHTQTFDSLLAHVPGIVVAVPSNARDAAGLLNSAFVSPHPVAFLYPKSLLNDSKAASLCAPGDVQVPFGRARLARSGKDLTMVSWGTTLPLCLEAAKSLAEKGFEAEILDLRTLSPWDREAVLGSCTKTGRLLVVHEDNLSAGFGAEVVAWVAERLGSRIAVRRLARPDTLLPYNVNCQMTLLPQTEAIVEAAAEMLGVQLSGDKPQSVLLEHPDLFVMRAFRASPSDTSFRLLGLSVKAGQEIQEGESLGEYETEKASAEFVSPVAGTVESILVRPLERLEIGAPILSIRTRKMLARPAEALPVTSSSAQAAASPAVEVVCSAIGVARGSVRKTNEELLLAHEGKTFEDIVRVTGIESRWWVAPEEDRVELAARAAMQVLESAGEAAVRRIGLVLVSTTSLEDISPSTACKVVGRLGERGVSIPEAAAMDISAACSGFLYGLRLAYDHVQSSPGELVLLLTSETLSPLLNEDDFSTHILFGDAATAVLVGAQGVCPLARFALRRPVLRAKPDKKQVLVAPALGSGRHIEMDGSRVFREAVRSMSKVARQACQEAQVAAGELDLVIAHQANQRILDAVAGTLGLSHERLASNIRENGNTSSSSIPLLLSDLERDGRLAKGQRLCLCAFGAGFTFGAVVVKSLAP